jgi:hypothetical protein
MVVTINKPSKPQDVVVLSKKWAEKCPFFALIFRVKYR